MGRKKRVGRERDEGEEVEGGEWGGRKGEEQEGRERVEDEEMGGEWWGERGRSGRE